MGFLCNIAYKKRIIFSNLMNTEDPRYNDSVCYQRFWCKIEFAIIKKLDMDLSKAWITDIFEHFFHISYVLCIFRIASPRRF